MEDQGWVKIWRKLRDNPWVGDPNFLALWVHILMEATHKERPAIFKGQKITLKPGQFITGRKYLCELTGIKRTTLERNLEKMERDGQIGQQTTTKNRLITVLNWDQYQTGGQQTGNKRATNGHIQEGENEKNERKEPLASGATPTTSATEKRKDPDALEKRTNIQKVVDRYFDLQEVEPSARSVSYPRHVRDAQALIKACQDDVSKAQAVLEALHRWASQNKMSYTIGTALKRWQHLCRTAPTQDWSENMRRIQDEVDKYKREHTL